MTPLRKRMQEEQAQTQLVSNASRATRATQALYDFAGPCIHVLESCPISNFIDGSDSFR
jgi:hypothetical protein